MKKLKQYSPLFIAALSVLIAAILLTIVTRKPDAIIKGKPAFINETCLKSHEEVISIPTSYMREDGTISISYQFVNTTVCDSSRVDTIIYQTRIR